MQFGTGVYLLRRYDGKIERNEQRGRIMMNYNIEVSIKYCRDCQEVLGDRTSSWLFADIDRANAWMLKELGACIRWLVSGRGCKVSIRKYQGA